MVYKSTLQTLIGPLILKTDAYSVLSISILDNKFVEDDLTLKTVPKIMIDLKNQLTKYFNKELKYFNIKLNFDNFSPLQIEVYKFLMKSKYGELISYKYIGDNLNSKAYRAIGSFMKKNPFPIIIPCHRVILNSKKMGQYSLGNIKNKKILIDLEQ